MIHAARLERWVGPNVEVLSRAMADWYGPPIAVGGVPGAVYAHKGGDFSGKLRAGFEATAFDYARDYAHRLRRGMRRASARQGATLHAGFASLSDLIAEATAGKRREFLFNKVGTTGVVNVTNSLWGVGPQPAAGANGSAAPGGRAPTPATTGAFIFTNPTGGDTQHFVAGYPAANFINNLLLYDRVFDVAKTMNSTTNESVTGVPTRYQSSTPGNPGYAGGNFLFVEVGGTALSATAHNWNALYRDDAGTDSQTLPTLTGNSGAIVRRLDHPAGQWFAPLATGDVGIMDLAEIDCSAAVAAGEINFVIGHPIAWLPVPIVNMVCVADGINTAFNLVQVLDDSCLAFLEVLKPATNATTYTGTFTTVSG